MEEKTLFDNQPDYTLSPRALEWLYQHLTNKPNVPDGFVPERLQDAVKTLPSSHQEIIYLAFEKTLDFKSIGKKLGATESEVARRLGFAYRKLRHPSRFARFFVQYNETALDKLQRFADGVDGAQTTIPKSIQDISLDHLDMSVRILNCLKRAGMATLGDVVLGHSAEDIMAVRHFNRACYDWLVEFLAKYNIRLSSEAERVTANAENE